MATKQAVVEPDVKSDDSLFASVKAAHDEVKVKAAARDKAATALQEAASAHQAAVAALADLQKQLNDILGLATGDSRVRMG